MTFLNLNGINDVQPPEVHPEARVPLCIVDAKVTEKDGKTNIRCILSIEEPHPTAGREWANLFHYVSMPTDKDDADKVQTKLRMAKQFFIQAGIPFDNGVNVEEMVGCRFEGNIVLDEFEGVPNNKLKPDPLPRDAR